jgi:transposase-like protein
LAGHHQPVTVWLVCLYLMGLNLSNAQIAAELDLAPSEAQTMTTYLREGLQARTPAVTLTGIVEIDETYLIAGHKGYPQAVAQAGRRPRRRRLKGKRGRGTLADEKPPVVGFLQRDGTLVLLVLPNVQRATIAPYVTGTIAPGTLIYTDEYGIYHQLPAWGYQHQTVNHSAGEYARDADGDGFYEIHINTLEGVWSLLRSWLRPHRGVSQEKLPAYVSFFAWVHNLRQRGQALFAGLLAALLAP